ncbi:MAG: hypothetical protein B7Z73_11775, partial [Planctomycetia bacterium 21-64-5]
KVERDAKPEEIKIFEENKVDLPKGARLFGTPPGENKCKGMGGCEVPFKHDAAWKKARKRFEELMKKEGKKVGPAPEKKKS